MVVVMHNVEMKGDKKERRATSGASGVFFSRSRRVE